MLTPEQTVLPRARRPWMWGITAITLTALGTWAIRLQAEQARDTVRKHDIEDLEHALTRSARAAGTYPPEGVSSWCGTLTNPRNRAVRDVVEAALRRDDKYAKSDKPFPADPRYAGTDRDYFYWKTSPVSFELLAELEADRTDARDTTDCGGSVAYDYSVVSQLRTPF
jgi:hypothetical protein